MDRKTQDSRTTPRDGAAPSALLDAARRRLDRLISFSRASLLWERVWRALLVPALVIGVFLCLSFTGLWLEVGRTWRILGVALLCLGLLIGVVPLLRLALPSRKEALARIDRASGIAHHPATGLDDTLANPGEDSATQALWALHRRRVAQTIAALRAATPSPRMVDLDRYALRAMVLFALIASAFLAGPEKYARVAAALDWRSSGSETGGFRADAWIDPPPYTGKAPLLLNVTDVATKNADHPVKIEAPAGSTLIARAAGGTLRVETKGPTENVKDAKTASQPAATPPEALSAEGGSEQRFILHGDASIGLWHGDTPIGFFELSAIPDNPPQIQLTDIPHANARGSLTVAYKISDDYGVIGADAEFRTPSVDGKSQPIRSLVDPPHLTLNLAPGPGGLGEAETTGDLSDHPWSGARVTMTLAARDEGGNVGRSDPIEIVLPQKTFTKPIARALAEQRRNLVLFPDDRERVETALEALMLAPEQFGTTTAVYLGLDVGDRMVRKAKTDADILEAADYLWAMALEIENGNLTEAERDLRAAEQKLREALQRNASNEEIAKLSQDLKNAMDKFLKEFAEKQMRDQGRQDFAERADPRRTMSQKDLQSMLDRMQEFARSGDRANAEKMLEQLQNMLENLQMGRREQDPSRREMNQTLNDLDKMSREQEELRDDTHRQGQQPDDNEMRPSPRRRMPGMPGMPQQGRGDDARPGNDQHGQESDKALQQRQQALRERLDQLQKRMQQQGRGQPGLKDADKAMRDAEQSLGQGQQGLGDAEDAQGRAVEALRREADNLSQQMQQGEGQSGDLVGEEEGENGESFRAQGSEDSDPLGRPLASDPLNPRARFDPMGIPAAQRAQRVLEELRRRLADPFRPREEMDYLERLLKRY